MNKVNKAAKIRTLLAEGVSVKDIAKKLKYAEPYVAQVKWHWKKATGKKRHLDKNPAGPKKAKAKEPSKLIAAAEAALKLLRQQEEPKEWAVVRGDPYAESHQVPVEENFLESEWANAFSDDQAAQGIDWVRPELKDMVNSPSHYTAGGIETIDFIEAKKLGYHLGNVVKYVSRAPHKGRQLEDLKKARWYLDREIENLEGTW